MVPNTQARIEPDLEALREALLACVAVRASYRRRIGGRVSSVELEPHGILFGQRCYLVAFSALSSAWAPKLYALANLSNVEPTDQGFERRESFDFQVFAAQLFGVLKERPLDIVRQFTPVASADALEHHSHATEKKQRLVDGGLEVRFRAGGLLEMCWHLFTWGDGVSVVC